LDYTIQQLKHLIDDMRFVNAELKCTPLSTVLLYYAAKLKTANLQGKNHHFYSMFNKLASKIEYYFNKLK